MAHCANPTLESQLVCYNKLPQHCINGVPTYTKAGYIQLLAQDPNEACLTKALRRVRFHYKPSDLVRTCSNHGTVSVEVDLVFQAYNRCELCRPRG